MAKILSFNNNEDKETRKKIKSGINQLAEAVKITLGPTGRVVIYEREYGDPAITKDGVTVARNVELEDPIENMAAQMVRQAAAKTAGVAGDGTTTATIYVQAIYEAGLRKIEDGANPQEVKRGIEAAVAAIIDKLSGIAKPVIDLDQIKQVAICSSNQDKEVGEMIATAMDQVGKDGVITIEEGQSLDTSVTVIDGLQFPRGYVSPQFATEPETQTCEFDEPNLLVSNEKLTDLKTALHILEMSVKQLRGKPLVIIADDFSDDVITALVLNRIKSQLPIVAIKAPGFGDRRRDTLEDICIATGATLVSKDSVSLAHVSVQHLGKCNKIKIDRDTTTILEGHGSDEKVEERVNLLRNQIGKVAGDFDRERLQERLACLTGGVAQISVGGATEVEVREKKDRIDDALHACKAAIEEGILPGGGVAALHAIRNLDVSTGNDDFDAGIKIIIRAVEAPLRQIAINTGVDDGVVVDKITNNDDANFGFDARRREYGDLIEMGVIVPAKVERIALQNATSVASLLLTTDCAIAIKREVAAQQQPQFPSLM